MGEESLKGLNSSKVDIYRRTTGSKTLSLLKAWGFSDFILLLLLQDDLGGFAPRKSQVLFHLWVHRSASRLWAKYISSQEQMEMQTFWVLILGFLWWFEKSPGFRKPWFLPCLPHDNQPQIALFKKINKGKEGGQHVLNNYYMPRTSRSHSKSSICESSIIVSYSSLLLFLNLSVRLALLIWDSAKIWIPRRHLPRPPELNSVSNATLYVSHSSACNDSTLVICRLEPSLRAQRALYVPPTPTCSPWHTAAWPRTQHM